MSEEVRSGRRRELRTLLKPYARPSYALGLVLLGMDLLLYGVASWVVVAAPWWGKLIAALMLALLISRLFVLGHDACHQALTPSHRLNHWLGRLAFLPAYSTYSLWQAGHNVAHHGFTNLRPRDVPWVPLTPAEYRALSPLRQRLYRVYRSWWGAGLYYGYAVWWKEMIFPEGKTRRSFVLDSWLVTAYFVAHITAYVIAAKLTGQSVALLLLCGIVLPFIVWLYIGAIVFYIHHTDETAHFFETAPEWREAQPNLDGVHDAQLPLRLDLLLHNVMRHTAHHLNASIPCYRLGAAQRALVAAFPAEVKLRRVGVRRYFAITKQCQLYDQAARRWLSCSEVESAGA